MDWNAIILAICGILAAIDLTRFMFPRLFRREKEAEIKGKEAESESIAVETLKKANEALSEQLRVAHETIRDYESRNRVLSDENGNLKATCTALFDDMCVHKGCKFRKPHQGQGSKWYEKYREDPALGADYDSIDTLIRKERLMRLKAVKEIEGGTGDGTDK